MTDLQRLENDRVHAQGPVGEANARFQSAFDEAAIGMALVDRNGRGLEVNDALSRITGYSREELKATTLRAMTHPDDDALDNQLERDLLSGQIPSYQDEQKSKSQSQAR